MNMESSIKFLIVFASLSEIALSVKKIKRKLVNKIKLFKLLLLLLVQKLEPFQHNHRMI